MAPLSPEGLRRASGRTRVADASAAKAMISRLRSDPALNLAASLDQSGESQAREKDKEEKERPDRERTKTKKSSLRHGRNTLGVEPVITGPIRAVSPEPSKQSDDTILWKKKVSRQSRTCSRCTRVLPEGVEFYIQANDTADPPISYCADCTPVPTSIKNSRIFRKLAKRYPWLRVEGRKYVAKFYGTIVLSEIDADHQRLAKFYLFNDCLFRLDRKEKKVVVEQTQSAHKPGFVTKLGSWGRKANPFITDQDQREKIFREKLQKAQFEFSINREIAKGSWDRLRCKNNHSLQMETLKHDWACSECIKSTRGAVLVCTQCAYYLCPDCLEKQESESSVVREATHLLPHGVAWIIPEIWKTDTFQGGWRVLGPEKDWRLIDAERRIGEGKRTGLLVDVWKAHIEEGGLASRGGRLDPYGVSTQRQNTGCKFRNGHSYHGSWEFVDKPIFQGHGRFTLENGTFFDGYFHWSNSTQAGYGIQVIPGIAKYLVGWTYDLYSVAVSEDDGKTLVSGLIENSTVGSNIIATTKYQGGLTNRDMKLLLTSAKVMDYTDDEPIIREGERSDQLYVIKEGQCEVRRWSSETENMEEGGRRIRVKREEVLAIMYENVMFALLKEDVFSLEELKDTPKWIQVVKENETQFPEPPLPEPIGDPPGEDDAPGLVAWREKFQHRARVALAHQQWENRIFLLAKKKKIGELAGPGFSKYNDGQSVSAVTVYAKGRCSIYVLELPIVNLLLSKHFGLGKRFFRQLAMRISDRLSSLIVIPKGMSQLSVTSSKSIRHVRSETSETAVVPVDDKDATFRKLFNIPEVSEVVFQEYVAGLSKKDLVTTWVPRMYISEHYICFLLRKLGFEKTKSFKIELIGQVESSKSSVGFTVEKKGKYVKKSIHFANPQDAVEAAYTLEALTGTRDKEDKEKKEEKNPLKRSGSHKSLRKSSGVLSQEGEQNTAELSRSDWQTLLTGATVLMFERGDVILAEGQAAGGIFQLNTGVCSCRNSRGEARLFFRPPELFGLVEFLQGKASITVVAETSVRVTLIDGRYLNVILVRYPKMASKFYHYVASQLLGRFLKLEKRLVAEERGEKDPDEALTDPTKGSVVGGVVANVDTLYEVKEEIGSGAFSKVNLGIERATGRSVAIKFMSKSVYKNHRIFAQREVIILKLIEHPNVVKLLGCYEDKESIILVFEYVEGGALYSALNEIGHYSESVAAHYLRDVVSAVEYLHANSIIHRDLKPANLLLTSKKKTGLVKVTDFGLSSLVDPSREQLVHSRVGTQGFMAPEVEYGAGRGYNNKCDIYSLGVIAYQLLCGRLPDDTETYWEQFNVLEAGAAVSFQPKKLWDRISKEAKDFIEKCMKREANERPTAAELLKHPWLQLEEDHTIDLNDLKEKLTSFLPKTSRKGL